jgi:hypothetical protein
MKFSIHWLAFSQNGLQQPITYISKPGYMQGKSRAHPAVLHASPPTDYYYYLKCLFSQKWQFLQYFFVAHHSTHTNLRYYGIIKNLKEFWKHQSNGNMTILGLLLPCSSLGGDKSRRTSPLWVGISFTKFYHNKGTEVRYIRRLFYCFFFSRQSHSSVSPRAASAAAPVSTAPVSSSASGRSTPAAAVGTATAASAPHRLSCTSG